MQDVGHHLLGGNVYDRNTPGEIYIDPNIPGHPAAAGSLAQGGDGGVNLPVKTTGGDPMDPVEGLLYLNTIPRQEAKVYADGAWRTLHILVGARRGSKDR